MMTHNSPAPETSAGAISSEQHSASKQPSLRIPRTSFIIGSLLILALCLAIRLFAASWWHGLAEQENRIFRFGDSASYWTLGHAIAKGLPYQYGGEDGSVFRAPAYPLLLSTIAWIQPQAIAVWYARVIGCLLGTLTVAIAMRMAYRLGGPIPALATGILCTLYPGAIGMSATILSEALFMPLMLLHLLLLQTAFLEESRQPSTVKHSLSRIFIDGWQPALLSGAIAGIAILARPSWLLFPPMAAAIHLLVSRSTSALLRGCWLGLGIIVVMAPWWYRNYLVTDRFVLTTLQVGPSLYDGLHPGASGGSDEGMAFVGTFAESLRKKEAQLATPLESTFEYRLNREMQTAATHWALSNPAEFARLAWIKFCRTWNLWPPAQELSSVWVRLSESIGCFSILGLACFGCWLFLTRWREYYLYTLPAIYFTLLHMIFVGSVRYRQPAIVAISVLAGMSAMWILGRLISPTRAQQI